jgi:hypothetical protein
MAFFFEPFPTVQYDVKKNNKLEVLTNITVRFRIQEVLTNRTVVAYDYNVKENERPDVIAYKYYDDQTLDWIILLTNNIINPNFDWPLDNASLQRFIRDKYGSINSAKNTVHHYEQIIRESSTRFDGSVIPRKTVWVDEDTYNTLSADERILVTQYDFEEELNDDKRQIKILDRKYIRSIVNEVENIFE